VKSNTTSGPWQKGTLHVHTNQSPCGHYPLAAVLENYSNPVLGYDFIAITDHCVLTGIPPSTCTQRLLVFPGVEYKQEKLQFLGINITKYEDNGNVLGNHSQLFADVQQQGGFSIICHPHIYQNGYWPLEDLLQLEGFLGIEIFNQNVKMNNSGRAVATDIWDSLLTAGKRVWGFAGDDMHHYSRMGGAYLMVQTADRTLSGIQNALVSGRFYSSTGITIECIEWIGRDERNHWNESKGSALRITVDPVTAASGGIRFIGDEGKVLHLAENARIATYQVDTSVSYIRAEVYRDDGAFAWTQPFFIQEE